MKNKTIQKDLFFSRTSDYLNIYLPNQAHKSERTIKTYRDALSVFRRYLWDEKGISILRFKYDDCTHEFLLKYLEHLSAGHKPSSCNNRMAAIKAYLWYAADCDISLQSVALAASRIPRIREPKITRATISEGDFAALLLAPAENRIGIRDQTIMILLYDSAIRVSELIELDVASINLKALPPYIHVHGKGDKERSVVITDKTAAHLKRYISEYHVDNNRNSPLFYTTIKGRQARMSSGNVERLINKYADQIRSEHPDLPSHVHPHMFRNPNSNKIQTFCHEVAISTVLST